jgi:hypothetical protein
MGSQLDLRCEKSSSDIWTSRSMISIARWRSFQSIIHLPHTIFTCGAPTISWIIHTLRNHGRRKSAPTELQTAASRSGMDLCFQDAGTLGRSSGQSSEQIRRFELLLFLDFVLSPKSVSPANSISDPARD